MFWKRAEWWILVVLIGVAVGSRMLALSYPREVVFDEVHFGKFVTAYAVTGENIFDIHPPHGKLLIAGVAKLAGYSEKFWFERIGEEYPSWVPVIGLRLVPAVLGSGLVLLVVWLMQLANASQWAKYTAGGLVALDSALISQSRLISLDMLLVTATLASVGWAWMAIEKESRGWWALAGVAAGLAVGAKFTGLVAIGLIGWMWLTHLQNRNLKSHLLNGLTAGLALIGVYGAGWAIHFAVLTEAGQGDAWREPMIRRESLISDGLKETVETHRLMLKANANISTEHPYASSAVSWPLTLRSVFYWSGKDGRVIYFQGNPAVWWGAGLGLVLAGFYLVRKLKLENLRLKSLTAILLMGYLASYLPLIVINRPLFLYHYLTPLLFSILLVCLWLDKFEWKKEIMGGWLVLTVLLYLMFLPVTYGMEVSENWLALVAWLPGWR